MRSKSLTIGCAILCVAALAVVSVTPNKAKSASTGNGSISGPHYNLNLIGVKSDKQVGDSNGHTIFVKLFGQTKIMLSPGEEFDVLDHNGTDGVAAFQLPNPDPENDGVTAYSVYLRPVGTPGGHGSIATCATDPGPDGIFGTNDDEEVCNTGSYVEVIERRNGQPVFKNVSANLLYIYVDIDDDGDIDRIPLFDPRLEDYFWKYDNDGLKVVQLRFYEVPTDVN
jgi:hypothetical protein